MAAVLSLEEVSEMEEEWVWRRKVSEVWCVTSPRREVGEGGGCQNSFEWHLILALCA